MYNLLIVDDEPIIRRGIKSLAILSEIGISEIFEAGNAEKCLEIIDKEQIDIIMLDINMPNTDGLTLAKILKEKNKNFAIIMVTGYDYFEYMQTAIRLGVDDYLLKPVNKTDIELVLRRMIDKIEKIRLENRLLKLNVTSKNITAGENSSFKAVREYMEEHLFDSDLSLGYIAENLGFNSSYLSGIIKQIYGIPFQEYLTLKRMEQAKILCLSTDMKNYEIAEEIGYEDVNYFTNRFKKTFGITPKQFKQGMKPNEN
ncbi:MAG: response regulator transcription factor [Catonella sp.]|uniref:response regulator transcription factor n=1 Tax=Catonella sp. TaxID=2382125 RepID=UPI003FA07B13